MSDTHDNDTEAELAAWELLREARAERDEARRLAAFWRDTICGEFSHAAKLPWEQPRPSGNTRVSTPQRTENQIRVTGIEPVFHALHESP